MRRGDRDLVLGINRTFRWSKSKIALDKAAPLKDGWRLHDLRLRA